MDVKKRESRTGRRNLLVILVIAMIVPLLAGGMNGNISKVQAASKIQNPRRGSDGVVTWDRVYFGRYPQSDASGETSDPIKWRVLSVSGDDVFLVADCNLDAWQYNSKEENVTWETSTIRSWLNGYGGDSNADNLDYKSGSFISRAFTASEQNAILTTTVVNTGNPNSKYTAETNSSNTSDRIFLLSYAEVTNPSYGFSSGDAADSARKRANTAYVGAGGSARSRYTNPAGSNNWWWLRTPGYFLNNAMFVTVSGIAYQEGAYVESGKYAVCPALHLKLSASGYWSYAGTINSNGAETKGEAPPSVEQPVTDPGSGAAYDKTGSEDGNETIEYVAPKDGATEVVVPDKVTISGTTYTVTSIADNAFKNNKKIKKVVVGSRVKSIGKSAFEGCSNLQTVTMGNNVTSIGEKAFYKCAKLKKFTIPVLVNKIGKKAFYGCKNLKTITVKTTKLTKKKVGSNAFKGIYSKAAFKVPKSKLKSYKTLLKAKGAGSKVKIKK